MKKLIEIFNVEDISNKIQNFAYDEAYKETDKKHIKLWKHLFII